MTNWCTSGRLARRALGLLTAAVLLLSGCAAGSAEDLSGSGSQPSNQPGQTDLDTRVDTLRIAYYAPLSPTQNGSGQGEGAEGVAALNPFQTSSTMNLQLVPLLFDPLVRLDRTFTRDYVVAESVVVQGLECVITLRRGLVFSDGSPLTAEDVLYSIQQVRLAGGAYSGLLNNVEQAEEIASNQIRLTLLTPDQFFGNMLTFPIVKKDAPTVGSGRYKLNGSVTQPTLLWNDHWYGPTKSRIQMIELVNQIDKDTLIYSLKLGTINYAYSDLEDNEALSLGVGMQAVPLNNLVYLGMNHTKNSLSYSNLRQALLLALERAELVNETLGDRAEPAFAPFQPLSGQLMPPDYTRPQDLAAASALLEELGYAKDEEGYYTARGGGRLRLSLLVNAEHETRVQMAEVLQKQLQKLGVELVLDARPFEEYKRALELWEFDLYLGEVKLYNNMDLSSMLTSTGKLGYGLVDYEELLAANEQLKAGTLDAPGFAAVFDQYVPFVPLMYRNGAVLFSRDAYFNTEATEQDIFYNIEAW